MKKFSRIVLVLLISLFIYSLFRLNEIKEFGNALSNEQKLLNISKNQPTEATNQVIDLDYMESINKDIFAWITIPGTSINYPILQTSDNEYYLNHSYSNVKSSNGAIFIDYKNTRNFNDTITNVYGHNVSDEYMFGSISKYKNNNYMLSHPSIEIYTNNNKYTYLIDQFYEVNKAEVSSVIYNNIDHNKNKVLLITCSYSNGKGIDSDMRYMLVATRV